jgi:glycosyltransferase involved in cell wall biosynthesis
LRICSGAISRTGVRRERVFSVVVPIFNARATLARAVESVLAQAYADFELILVDDGSTDGSLTTLTDPLDPRIVVVRQPNAGEGAARNRGIEVAGRRWVAFIDADDIWLPDHLAELERVIRRFPQARLVGTRTLESDFSGRYAIPRHRQDPTIELIHYFERMAREPRPMTIVSAAVARGVVEQVGPFGRHGVGADSEFLARVALQHPVAASSRPTAVYIHGHGSVTERAGSRWKGGRVRTAAEISPAVATVLRHCSERPAEAPPGVDGFVDRYIGWCLRSSVRIADIDTVRALRPMYRRTPPAADRVLLAVCRLPAPVANRMRRPASLVSRLVEGELSALLPASARGSFRPARADP